MDIQISNSSKGKEFVNNDEIVGHLLCDLSFAKGVLKLYVPILPRNNWLSIGMNRESE